MNRLYVKGLIKKNKIVKMLIILLLGISLFIFLIAYKNNVDKKIYDEKNVEIYRTINADIRDLDLSKFNNYIENYECNDSNNCIVVFKTYILKNEFIEKYNQNIINLSETLGMQSDYLTLLNILNISVVVIMVFLIICIIAFIINYFSFILRTIKLYHVLGYSVFKSLACLNILFFAILETYSIIVMTIIKIFNTNYILYQDYMLITIIVSFSCILSGLITRLVIRKSLL